MNLSLDRLKLGVTGEKAIVRTFELMGIAEEEIALAKKAVKSKAAQALVHRAFMALTPPEGMSGLIDTVYRQHCVELLARVVAKKDLVPGTDAECMVALMQTSLAAPLTSLGSLVMVKLWRRVVGDLPPGVTTVDLVEPYKGAVAEELHKMRRRCGNPNRKLSKA